MRRIAIVAVEGVLAETPDLKATPPNKTGKALYDALKPEHRIVLLSENTDYDLVRFWLRKEGFNGYALMRSYPSTSVMDKPTWKVSVIREMLGDGWDIAMVIDTNEDVSRRCVHEGVPSLTVSYPAMAVRPGRLPETPPPLRSWESVTAKVEEQNLLEQGG